MEDRKNEILDYSEEDGPYIEIELDTAVTTAIDNDGDSKNNCINDDAELEQQEEEYKLRISISSTISVSLQKESIVSFHSDTSGADDTRTCADNSQATMSPHTRHSGVSYNTDEVEFPVQNKLFSTVSFSPWQSPQPDGQTTILRTNSTRVIPYDNVDVLYAPRNSNHWNLEDASLRKSKKMEIDLGAFKGVFNAIGGMSRRRSKRRTVTSSSSNNSPIHEGYSKDNSIQAAIAYCKSSFGQTSDFTFTTSITSTPSRFVAYSD
ncbi:hypothetical protein P8452_65143 [Trifolium repens]|nr:hypothetical protein P8452_65143 [Trifolium repens]